MASGGTIYSWEVGPGEEVLGALEEAQSCLKGNLGVLDICNMVY